MVRRTTLYVKGSRKPTLMEPPILPFETVDSDDDHGRYWTIGTAPVPVIIPYILHLLKWVSLPFLIIWAVDMLLPIEVPITPKAWAGAVFLLIIYDVFNLGEKQR